jgi:hypothetical protein
MARTPTEQEAAIARRIYEQVTATLTELDDAPATDPMDAIDSALRDVRRACRKVEEAVEAAASRAGQGEGR